MAALLTPDDLALRLGLSRQTIYNRMNIKGDLPPFVKVCGKPRFCAERVEKWLKEKFDLAQVEHTEALVAELSSTPSQLPSGPRRGRRRKVS